MLTLRNLVIVLILSIGLLGCGKENIDIPNTEEVESIQEHSEIAVEEIDTKEESSVKNIETEETIETEMEQNTDTNPMVDWETFAAQEGNEEICLVVYNEITGHQEILLIPEGETNVLYIPKEGDKFAVPIREEIWWIDFTTIKNLEIVSDEKIYFRDESIQPPEFLEVSFPKGSNYNLGIGIWSEDTDEYMQFFIQNE